MRDIGPLLKGHDFYSKCDSVLHAILKKFKKIHVNLENLINELSDKLEDKDLKDKSVIQKHL
jgi:hypothetical protein